MLLNRSEAKLHLLFGIPTIVVTLGCTAYYWHQSAVAGRWVGGGSHAGLLCGLVAGAIIVFEMLLWPRKVFRRLRLIAAKYWMAAHLWFGLASLPLAILHCGFNLGGWLPATFMILFLLTIVSGVYGMCVQNILPRWMLRNLPAETIYSQIDYISEQTVEDARQVLLSACGRQAGSDQTLNQDSEFGKAETGAIVVGAVRNSGRTRGRVLQTRQFTSVSVDSVSLWNAFDEIKPFLLRGRDAITPVTDRQRASAWFVRLRSVCGEESGTIVDLFESFCDQRRQFDTQATVHRWLHAWIPIHIGLSVAMSVLFAAHVWTALKYW